MAINKYEFFQEAKNIEATAIQNQDIILKTPLEKNLLLSEEFEGNIFLKREDLQIVRSYKIRGAYNKINSLTEEEIKNGVVCASAGNHAQGVAYACFKKQIKGYIFMPKTAPAQKVKRVHLFGKNFIELTLVGDSFDDAYKVSKEFANKHNLPFIHPFNDPKTIEGQGTIAYEIFQEYKEKVDYIIVPVGGGGLISGVSIYSKYISPETKIIGVEPEGAASLTASLAKGEVVELEKIDTFIDGAAVKKMGGLNFEIIKKLVDEVYNIPEGLVCSTILKLYNEMAIVVEPAGALAIAALHILKDKIKGKNTICLVTGNNNDILRTEEIRERSMLYEGLKHYFIINFAQRSGALKIFVNKVLQETDNIVRFEYMQRNHRENGPAIVGIEIVKKDDIYRIFEALKVNQFAYEYLNNNLNLLELIL